MSYEGYTIEDDYLYIDFSETRENKKLINRVIEEAKEQRESISRAIESLQVPDSVLRGYGDELIPVKNSISKDINQLQRLNLHIDYVMRRFEEVDNEFAARFRTAGYELQETLGLERDSGIFEAFVGGLKLVVLQGVRAWSGFSKSIKDPAAQLEQHIKKWFKDDEQKADKTAIITMSVDRLHISNKNVLEETQGMYDYIKDGPTDKTWQLIAISQGWGIITYEEYCKRKSAQETNNQPYATGIGRMGPSKTTPAQKTGNSIPITFGDIDELPRVPFQTLNGSAITVELPEDTGDSGGATITSGTINPITQAAINAAKIRLNGFLDKYYPYEWPSSYKIGDKTLRDDYNSRYLNEINRANDIAEIFNVLDLAEDISRSFEELSNKTNVTNPYTLAISSVLIGTWRNRVDEEPGVSEIPDGIGLIGWITNNIAQAKEKLDFVESSDYKYLVYSGSDGDGPRGKFIKSITKYQNEIRNTSYSIYSSSKENETYKQALLEYLDGIKKMNVNYKESLSDMNFYIDRIDEKYR